MKDHYFFMDIAIEEAKIAAAEGEVPVGAVVVKNSKVIAKGHNTKERQLNPICHGEINVINTATRVLKQMYLDDCTLYVTMEPCPMCAGAILQSRVGTVVFGCWDVKWGAAGSVIKILPSRNFNHCPRVIGGIKEDECTALIRDFFEKIRRKGL